MTPQTDADITLMLLFTFALALLAAAILMIRYFVRKRDVLHGGFVKRGEDEDRSG